MNDSDQQRHKPLTTLDRPRELIVACPQFRSGVNLSRIVRTASCCGVERMVVSGRAKVDPEIARDGAERVRLEVHRSLGPALKKLRGEGYKLVGLEQTSNAQCLYEFRFPQRAVLVLGHERQGISDELLALLDLVVEIPVYGLPYSHNVATAAAMAMYEYCRQYPRG
ncbi:MAG: RNA methyltransferase [Pirellulaceae bacterium]|nr:RNA methyltransferase [Pirellulaceae bacterium]